MKRAAASILALVFAVTAAFAQVPNVGGLGVPNSSGSGSGGGGVPQGAWTAFTPNPTCGTATFTTQVAGWQQIAPKSTLVRYEVLVNTIGTCNTLTSNLSMNLPNTANAGASLIGYDFTVGVTVLCTVTSGSNSIVCRSGAGISTAGSLTSGSHFVISAVYENQ